MKSDSAISTVRSPRRRWLLRAIFIALISIGVAVVWVTNQLMTDRLTETVRTRAEVRLAAYVGNINSELQRNAIVPLLLSRDPALIGALNSSDFSQTSQRLISIAQEINVTAIRLLDSNGRVVAATDRAELSANHRAFPYFIDALRWNDTVFTANTLESGQKVFAYSRRIRAGNEQLGVIVVEMNLRRFEQNWAGFADAVIVTDSEGQIILSTEARWRGLSETDALARQSAPSAIHRALQATADWTALPADAYLRGEAVMRREARIGFQGWKIASFTTYTSIRERVNSVIAIEIMFFAILLSGMFYLMSRKATSRLDFFRRESAELRQLNEALQREIAERERAEANLQVVEQSLQQSSKLAILGEMSAAVSHELNQPLAAMKTYLAGARLLLQRKRSAEALSSFQRIDDLIDRMGAITRQLKGYARKGGDVLDEIDVIASISTALDMMEPQIRRQEIAIRKDLPAGRVTVMADRVRLEQVLINLLRNAIDAVRSIEAPEVVVTVQTGDTVIISVGDNGVGIEDLENLFEPFYTTKPPGDGVGLGLAISSGIINDLGGRLTARNRNPVGAVFEIRLPAAGTTMKAAE